MQFLKRTSRYVVNHTKRQAVKELKNDSRINTITSGLGNLKITTNPIIPKGFEGDELFIYPVAIFKIIIKMQTAQLRQAIIITPKIQRVHPHIFLSPYSICWGEFKDELLEMKKHRDWYWIVKTILDFLNDYGTEDRDSPNGVGINWVDRRLQWQLNYMKDNPKVKEELKALGKNYRKKYKMYGTSDFR